MLKIIILFLSIFLLFSCTIKEDNEINIEKKLELEKNINSNLPKNSKDIKKSEDIINMNISEKNLILNENKTINDRIEKGINNWKDNILFIDLWNQKDHKKLEKTLINIDSISRNKKINAFELHCNWIDNFNKKELELLWNLKVNTLILQDTCWFRQKKFTNIWYDKDKLLSFFKKTKYIKELRIWNIDLDVYVKENWKIIKK